MNRRAMNKSVGLFFMLWPIVCDGLELGWVASMHNWPFVAGLVYIKDLNQPKVTEIFCTGTIVNALHILSTQGCVARKYNGKELRETPKNVWIWVGSGFAVYDKVTTGSDTVEAQFTEVREIIVPAQADTKTTLGVNQNEFHSEDYTYYYMDFSILRLVKELVFNRFVQPARFDDKTFRDSKLQYVKWKKKLDEETDYIPDCFMAGWGFKETTKSEPDVVKRSRRLLFTRVKFTPSTKCDLAYCTNCSVCGNSTEHLPNLYWCFSSYLWADTCPGDQGAPLYCHWFGHKRRRGTKDGAILGVHSVKPGTCNQAILPSKFSAIWFGYNFIERVLDQGRFPPPPLDIGDPDYVY